MKTVKETIGKIKGDNLNEVMTGKAAFSQTGFSDTINALVNDTSFKIPTYDKDGNTTGEMCISEMMREDLKKSIANAGYPQKSEIDVINTSEICTTNLAKVVVPMVMEYMSCGKKVDLPLKPGFTGSVYLAKVPAKEAVHKVRDIKTKADLGTCTINTKEHVKAAVKSPAPKYLQTKVRKDPNGKVIG